MNINKSCETCEFNFNSICASENYGEIIDSAGEDMECWSISFEYFQELNRMLPEKVRNDYITNPMIPFSEIYRLLLKWC